MGADIKKHAQGVKFLFLINLFKESLKIEIFQKSGEESGEEWSTYFE